jgi:hypothetical protein
MPTWYPGNLNRVGSGEQQFALDSSIAVLIVFACTKHIKSKHTLAGISCTLCQLDFKNNAALIQHLASKKHHKCKSGCSLTFMTTTELSTHIKLDHNAGSKNPPSASTSKVETTTPVTFPCSPCGMDFVSFEALQHHMRVDHAPKNPCPSCYQSFSSSSALDQHRSISHPAPKAQASVGLGCPMCKQTFLSAEDLSSHTRAAHPLEASAKKVYPCLLCDRTFSKKSKLTAHNDTTHPSGPVCAICRLRCSSQQILDDHVAAVHKRALCSCGTCDVAFITEGGLNHHYLQSSKEAHPKCVECDLGFENDAVYATACFLDFASLWFLTLKSVFPASPNVPPRAASPCFSPSLF